MKLIAHRGNFNGKNEILENTIPYIIEAINHGFDVEVDVWFVDDRFFLGHDGPQHHVTLDELRQIKKNSWFHAKNLDALTMLLLEQFHVFFHDQDDYTVTSCGFIWAYSGKNVNGLTIACMPEATSGFVVPAHALGVCSDNLIPFL